MSGEQGTSDTTRDSALAAFERRAEGCAQLLTKSLEASPHDGALLLAEAAALAEAGADTPFARVEAILRQAPDWVAGHKGLAELKIEFGDPAPLAIIETALAALPGHPSLWHAYLNLLAASGRHAEAADKTADLRRKVGNVPALALLEARYAGLAGDPDRGAALLAKLPHDVPDLHYQRARNALQRGEVAEAMAALDAAPEVRDMRIWAMRELCWRATGDERHSWLMHQGELVGTFDFGLSDAELDTFVAHLRGLHTTRLAPPSQSLRGGTQTRGNLHLREEPMLQELFAHFTNALEAYSSRTAGLSVDHPLYVLSTRLPRIANSWSVRLSNGGFHVPHLHDAGLLSSACHLVVPDAAEGEGVLELGRPPEDIVLDVGPFTSFAPLPGRLVLFPSFLYHGTRPFGAGERLSAVIDAD